MGWLSVGRQKATSMRPEILPLLLLTGCVSADLKPCTTVSLPPVPQKVFLQIEGDKILSDAGGDLLLRGYVAARDAK